MLMQTDTSKKGWGAMCQGVRTGGLRTKKEQENHTNPLELLATKSSDLQQNDEFQISTYLGTQPNCLELPLKDERDKEFGTFQSFEEIWDYLLKHQIMITAEYFPGCLNHQADWESRNQKISTDRKLCLQVLQEIC